MPALKGQKRGLGGGRRANLPCPAQPHATLLHLGEELSFLEMLRWKMEGAKHTARLPAVIWFSSAEAMSLRKYSRVCSTSRFSSGSSKVADCAAGNHCSLGRTVDEERQKGFLTPLESPASRNAEETGHPREAGGRQGLRWALGGPWVPDPALLKCTV